MTVYLHFSLTDRATPCLKYMRRACEFKLLIQVPANALLHGGGMRPKENLALALPGACEEKGLARPCVKSTGRAPATAESRRPLQSRALMLQLPVPLLSSANGQGSDLQRPAPPLGLCLVQKAQQSLPLPTPRTSESRQAGGGGVGAQRALGAPDKVPPVSTKTGRSSEPLMHTPGCLQLLQCQLPENNSACSALPLSGSSLETF